MTGACGDERCNTIHLSNLSLICNSNVTQLYAAVPINVVTVILLRHEIAIVVACESRIFWSPMRDRGVADEGPRRDGRLAAAGQWSGPNPQVAGTRRREARCHNRVSLAGRLPFVSGANLSGSAACIAEPPADIGAHRGSQARCHSYRDRGPDRLCGTRLLPKTRPAVYDELHDAISGIHRGAFADPGKLGLRCSALVSFRRKRDDGGDAFADQRTDRAWLQEYRAMEAGRGRRSVSPGSS